MKNLQITVVFPLINKNPSKHYQKNLKTITLPWNNLLHNIEDSKKTKKRLKKAAREFCLLSEHFFTPT